MGRRLVGWVAVVAVGVLLGAGCSSDDGGEADADGTTTTIEDATTTAVGDTTADDEAGEDEVGEDEQEASEGLETGRTPDIDYGAQDTWSGECTTGAQQSPIDLTGAVEATDEELPDIEFDYPEGESVVKDSGHSVEVEWEGEATMTLRDGDDDGEPDTYRLLQFHFHATSEHTIGDVRSPLEVHFVHEKVGGTQKAVLGILIDEGAENPAFTSLVDVIRNGGEPSIDPAAMLPEDQSYFHYDGSLTTPECTEGLAWQVFTTPIEMSADQIAAFTDVYAANAREVQPPDGRVIEDSRGS